MPRKSSLLLLLSILLTTPLTARASTHGGEGILFGAGLVLVAFLVGLITGANQLPFFKTLFKGLGIVWILITIFLLAQANFTDFKWDDLGKGIAVLIPIFGIAWGLFTAGFFGGRLLMRVFLFIQGLFSARQQKDVDIA